MDVKCKVHGVSHTSIPMTVDAGGQKVVAQVPALEVELVTQDDISGSLTLRFYGEELAEAEKIYVKDGTITFSTGAPAAFTPVPASTAKAI